MVRMGAGAVARGQDSTVDNGIIVLNPTLAAIVITGYSTESSAIEALNLGVAGYLTKPFGTTQVLAAAAKALSARPA